MTNVEIENSTIEHKGSYCTILSNDYPELDDEFINKIILSDVVEIYSMHEKLVNALVSSHHFEIVYKVRNRKRWELNRRSPFHEN
jgi:hypothetical protein